MSSEHRPADTVPETKPAPPPTATIIPESEHPIREQLLDREALKVLYRLRDAGFKGYLVGGGVRDLFLGKKPKDFDVSTDARPGELRRIFRNSRTIGRRFRLVQVFFHGNRIVEVSTLRSHSEGAENGEGDVLAANNTFGTLDEDAFRRDLTINALFYEIENHTVIDYVGGVADLNRGIIRMVGDPGLRFQHDPVRMLRAIRHAARTGFSIDPATFAALGEHASELMLCPPSRLRDEILKDLHSGASRAWAEQCMATPLWLTLFPFLGEGGKERVREMRTMLLRMLAEIDRINQSGTEEKPVHMDDHFLFAVLLLPWAITAFDLPGAERLQGARFHELALALRQGVEERFGTPFNIQRMAKDRICVLLMQLPTLHHASAGGKPPRWLKGKSYYAECKRFYDLYQLGLGDRSAGIAAEDFVQPKAAERAVTVISAVEAPSSRSHGRGSGTPVFSRQPGGVFGLCRKQAS